MVGYGATAWCPYSMARPRARILPTPHPHLPTTNMRAAILTIGDELLIGQVTDTNAAMLSERLEALGLQVVQHLTVSDERAVVREALAASFARAEVVITTGGLGATDDDLTRDAVAAFYGVPLVEHAPTMARVTEYFSRRERPMPERNRRLALAPEGFEVLENPMGTAPGLWSADTGADGRPRFLAILPGVPSEVRALWDAALKPHLIQHADLDFAVHRTLLTTGIGETNLAEVLGDLTPFLSDDVTLAFLPSTSGVRLRITARGSDKASAESAAAPLDAAIRARAARYLFGEGDDLLEAAVGRALRDAGLTLAVAESCTGGLVATRITDVPGSSGYFRGGIVAYCNSVKHNLLGVTAGALREHGAVSEVVAIQMAEGARDGLGSDIGVATTGIMGPTGATPTKPVGTVWLGYASAEGSRAVRLALTPHRATNKALASTAALDLVRRQVLRGTT